MGFLNPWLALAALGVAIPIVAHLLNRYRQKRIAWAAMDLLRQAVHVRSWQVRLEDLALLVLRCLAVLAVTLALARPVLSPPGGRLLGGEPSAGAVIAIDASFSMAHQGAAASRFERAVEQAEEIGRTLPRGNPVTLVLMGNRPRVLLRNAAYDPQEFAHALHLAAVLPEGLDLEGNLAELGPLLAELKAPERELYLVSDGQATSWGRLSAQAKAVLGELASIGRVHFVPVEAAGAENLAITGLELVSGTLRQGSVARYAAEVRNFGSRTAEKVDVSLFIDDVRVDQRTIDKLSAGESVAVPLFAPLTRSGQFALRAQLSTDALAIDDARFLVVQVRPLTRVLCVDGDPSDDPFRSETGYFSTALKPKEEDAAAGLLVNTVSWLSLPAQKLQEWDVIALANVAEIPAELAEGLWQFVQRGGGLIFFPGDNVNPAAMSKRLCHGAEPLLPAQLGEVAGEGAGAAEAEGGLPLELSYPDHPITHVLDLLPRDLLAEARVRKYLKVTPAIDARVILSLAGQRAPLVLEKSLGQGRVLLFTTSANRAWNSLPIHPMYPLLLQQAVTYLTRQVNETPRTVGQGIPLPAAGRAAGETAIVHDPAGATASLPVIERDGQPLVAIARLDKPGFYSVQAGKTGPPTLVAACVDTGESDVKCIEPEAMGQAFADVPVKVLAARQDLAAAIRQGRVGREIWRTLLAAGLFFMVAEAFMARRLSKSRAPRSPEETVA